MPRQQDPRKPAPDPNDAAPSPDDRDRAVMRGGPGQPDLEPEDRPAPPAKKRIKVGGREFEVDQDLAAAVETRETEFTRKISEQGRELGELRKRQPGDQPDASKTKTREPDYEDLLYSDPRKFVQVIKEQTRAELRAEYEEDQVMRDFWDGYGRRHPDLAEEELISRAMFVRHNTDLLDLPTRKAQDRLAELVSAEILRISRRGKDNGNQPKEHDTGKRAVVEGASGDRGSRTPADDEDRRQPKSLSEALALRRQQRRTAMTKMAGKK
jgi:hypothetical protein